MDKKKKILTVAIVAIIGGLVAINTTGGIKNLKSDTIWIDTGDGNGYYADGGTYDPTTNTYSNYDPLTNTVTTDPLQNVSWQTTAITVTNFAEIKELRNKIIKLRTDIVAKQGDEKTEGTIKYYEKQIKDLQSKKDDLQKNVDNANKNLAIAQAAQNVRIDIYDCTKNNVFKNAQSFDGKWYIYPSPRAFMNRLGNGVNTGEIPLAIQRFDAQIQSEKLTLSRINKNNTSAIEKQKKVISDLEKKKSLAVSERSALQSSTVMTKCYQPAFAIAKNAEPAIADAQKVVDNAQNKLQENTDKIKTFEGNITQSQDSIKQIEDQISQAEQDLKNLNDSGNNNSNEDNKRTKVEWNLYGCFLNGKRVNSAFVSYAIAQPCDPLGPYPEKTLYGYAGCDSKGDDDYSLTTLENRYSLNQTISDSEISGWAQETKDNDKEIEKCIGNINDSGQDLPHDQTDECKGQAESLQDILIQMTNDKQMRDVAWTATCDEHFSAAAARSLMNEQCNIMFASDEELAKTCPGISTLIWKIRDVCREGNEIAINKCLSQLNQDPGDPNTD